MSKIEPTEISVVIPARDEAAALGSLLAEIGHVLADRAFEVIVIDDGSRDGTPRLLDRLAARHPWLRGLRLEEPAGQSAAVRLGVYAAGAPLIVTLDGDGQNPPDQIPLLIAPFGAGASAALGLVQGQRLDRQDSFAKRRASGAANAIRGWLLRDGVRDSGCGMRAFRREAYLGLPWFDHIHRFMPALMQRDGWGDDRRDFPPGAKWRPVEIHQRLARSRRHPRPSWCRLADPARRAAAPHCRGGAPRGRSGTRDTG